MLSCKSFKEWLLMEFSTKLGSKIYSMPVWIPLAIRLTESLDQQII
jgi:hypothetical protein